MRPVPRRFFLGAQPTLVPTQSGDYFDLCLVHGCWRRAGVLSRAPIFLDSVDEPVSRSFSQVGCTAVIHDDHPAVACLLSPVVSPGEIANISHLRAVRGYWISCCILHLKVGFCPLDSTTLFWVRHQVLQARGPLLTLQRFCRMAQAPPLKRSNIFLFVRLPCCGEDSINLVLYRIGVRCFQDTEYPSNASVVSSDGCRAPLSRRYLEPTKRTYHCWWRCRFDSCL